MVDILVNILGSDLEVALGATLGEEHPDDDPVVVDGFDVVLYYLFLILISIVALTS